MSETTNILGCYVSISLGKYDDPQHKKDLAETQGNLFRSYIWGENGITEILKHLNYLKYGLDLELILFQFYVNPLQTELVQLKEIENYKKKEKSIGIPVIINETNFFSKTEDQRVLFLKKSIYQKLELLSEVAKKQQLDTNIELLKSDIQKLLN